MKFKEKVNLIYDADTKKPWVVKLWDSIKKKNEKGIRKKINNNFSFQKYKKIKSYNFKGRDKNKF